MDYVDPRRVQTALATIEGFPFERFVADFMAAMIGAEFVPLGGVNDGGADGLLDGGDGKFLQTSVRNDIKTKIRQCVRRLREFGRTPRQLIYVSANEIRFPDVVEDELTQELDVTIRLRDGDYIKSHINDSIGTRAAYFNHLHPLLLDLERSASGALVSRSTHVVDPSVFVFLSQEADEHRGSQSLMNDVVDALILWALEGTDPDAGILMTQQEILERVLGALPTVENLVKPRIGKRLGALSSKGGGGRRVRAHRKEGLYCLPYDTRVGLADDIAEDTALRQEVMTSLRGRIEEVVSKLDGDDPAQLSDAERAAATEVALRTVQLTFERQGVTFMSTLTSSLDDDPQPGEGAGSSERGVVYVSDHVAAALDDSNVEGARRVPIGAAVLAALRGVMYGSSEAERTYLRKLSKTYTLLFTLSLEPKLISYFQQMTGEFYLYVGSDQIVRALSEAYLAPADQVVTNTLKLASRAGATLVLTEGALGEAWYNLRTSDWEYQNTFALLDDRADFDIVRNSPKILVRAYMYARMGHGLRRPTSWSGFVNQFCDYEELHKPTAFDSLRRYFQAEYSFEYRSSSQLESLVNAGARDELTKSLVARTEKSDVLARNDALIALAVYGHRRKKHETSSISEFGYNTWWLTQESSILRHTRDLVIENQGTGYVMRPEFLLNFLTLAPSVSESRDAFQRIFPSLLGVNLSRRVPDKTFRTMLDQITKAEDLSESRRAAKISQLADKLKGDLARTYLSTHDNGAVTTGVDAVATRAITVID